MKMFSMVHIDMSYPLTVSASCGLIVANHFPLQLAHHYKDSSDFTKSMGYDEMEKSVSKAKKQLRAYFKTVGFASALVSTTCSSLCQGTPTMLCPASIWRILLILMSDSFPLSRFLSSPCGVPVMSDGCIDWENIGAAGCRLLPAALFYQQDKEICKQLANRTFMCGK